MVDVGQSLHMAAKEWCLLATDPIFANGGSKNATRLSRSAEK